MNILKDSQTPGDERRGMEGGGNHVNSYFCLFVHCYCNFTYLFICTVIYSIFTISVLVFYTNAVCTF